MRSPNQEPVRYETMDNQKQYVARLRNARGEAPDDARPCHSDVGHPFGWPGRPEGRAGSAGTRGCAIRAPDWTIFRQSCGAARRQFAINEAADLNRGAAIRK